MVNVTITMLRAWSKSSSGVPATIHHSPPKHVVCYTVFFSVSSRNATLRLRDDTRNGCVADYKTRGRYPVVCATERPTEIKATNVNVHTLPNDKVVFEGRWKDAFICI